VKTAERLKARRLRQEGGLSMKDIARVVGVSLSSVSLWVRDIELENVQQASLRCRAARRRGEAAASRARALRCDAQVKGREQARQGDPLHLAGCMLYWAEGSRDRNAAIFTNSDPEMVRLFVCFLRDCFGVPDDKLRITCNLFADHVDRQRAIEAFWLDVTALPRTRLSTSIVNVYSKHSKKKRRNKLPHGTCRVVVCDTQVVQSIYGAIQEYGGFDRPEWLG
jgi:transcriptional regulator with XRE-family HTH domain